MANGPYNSNPYSANPYRARSFNPSPYSLTPYNPVPYNPTPFTALPFNPTPYDPTGYNQGTLTTAFERINYVRQNRLNLPDKTARYYLNKHNSYQQYLKNKNNKT